MSDTVVGFDFGTTNSLVSVIVGDRALNILDDGLPFPSVVAYEGTRTIVGREARGRLDKAGLGVHDTVVRSPKTLLGEEVVHVGGVARSPVDLVTDVIDHVRQESLRTRLDIDLGDIRRAVVTIPIDMDGARRRALREAFDRAGIRVEHFVHEPFAALYAYFRSAGDADAVRRYQRQLVLVVDWGGGTLDLTLCRIGEDRITQLANHGTEDVGGDHFDEAIRNAVLTRYCTEYAIPPETEIRDAARQRLLRQCEQAKIDLSERPDVPLYVPSFFEGIDEDFDHVLGRSELEEITDPLVRDGIARIRALLEHAGVAHQQVAMCLATGGMTRMPAVRSRLFELFGPNCVQASDRTATLIAEGAAWLAHDRRRLTLAKSIELALARGSYLPVLPAGTEMPSEGMDITAQVQLYCADPRDGKAKFQFVTPRRASAHPQLTDPRDPLASTVVMVDEHAKPLRERLELDVHVDHDLILTASARSLNAGDISRTEVHGLQFGVPLPFQMGGAADDGALPTELDHVGHEMGDLIARENLADRVDLSLVPGELLYQHDTAYFEVAQRPPQIQVEERLYYEPCAVCRRASNDPLCRCGSTTGGAAA